MTVPAIYRALWRRKLFVAIVTIGVAVGAWALTTRQQQLYTASALVRIEQRVTRADDVFGALQTGERLARTYAEITQTRGIADRVERALGNSVPPDAVNISAVQVPGLELLRVSNTYSDPVVAARVANAVPAALKDLVSETPTNREVITTIERANVPSSPSSPNLSLNIALGLILGLILAAGLALVWEAASDRLPNPEELEEITGHSVIASIPTVTFRSPSADGPPQPAAPPPPTASVRTAPPDGRPRTAPARAARSAPKPADAAVAEAPQRKRPWSQDV